MCFRATAVCVGRRGQAAVVMREVNSTIRRLIGPDPRSATKTDAGSLHDGYRVELIEERGV
jgi:hypothetical protein